MQTSPKGPDYRLFKISFEEYIFNLPANLSKKYCKLEVEIQNYQLKQENGLISQKKIEFVKYVILKKLVMNFIIY